MEKLDLLQISGFLSLVVLLILLVVNSLKGKNIRPLLYFFLLPILLLGWRSLQSFEIIKNGIVLRLQNAVDTYKKNPTEANLEKVEETIAEAKNQKDVTPEVLEKQAEAEHIIGKNEEAKLTIEQAEKKQALSKDGLEFKKNIMLTSKIDEKIKLVERAPTKQNQDSLKIYRAYAKDVTLKSAILKDRILMTNKLLNNVQP